MMEFILAELIIFGICIGIGAAISGAIMVAVRSKLKSVKTERTACNYTRGGSFRTTNQKDTFLYNNIVRIPRPQNNSGGRRGGGMRRR
ncbi:MAG: hypothetical protein FWF80_06270 [Defluviitaleaceae bacterium]|nr:hypothetical protein [Defluviitaleaceae bacterium]